MIKILVHNHVVFLVEDRKYQHISVHIVHCILVPKNCFRDNLTKPYHSNWISEILISLVDLPIYVMPMELDDCKY